MTDTMRQERHNNVTDEKTLFHAIGSKVHNLCTLCGDMCHEAGIFYGP